MARYIAAMLCDSRHPLGATTLPIEGAKAVCGDAATPCFGLLLDRSEAHLDQVSSVIAARSSKSLRRLLTPEALNACTWLDDEAREAMYNNDKRFEPVREMIVAW